MKYVSSLVGLRILTAVITPLNCPFCSFRSQTFLQEALGAGPSEEQESAFKEPALVEPKKGKGKVPVVGVCMVLAWMEKNWREKGVLQERFGMEWIEIYV